MYTYRRGNPEWTGFFVTHPFHGGKVTCDCCNEFIDEGGDWFECEKQYSGDTKKYWCYHCFVYRVQFD